VTRSAVEPRTNVPVCGYSGKRFAIALGSWCLAAIGVLSSLMFAATSLAAKGSMASNAPTLLPLFAWVSLGVMSVRWVQAQRCHWLWPILGTVCGLISAAMFARVFFFYVSAVPLAIYLVFWHLKRSARGVESAA
jgi:hypothetical protein